MNTDWSANLQRFTGFADLYDRHRAGPPDGAAELLIQYAGGCRPKLAVDLGSGTGLSTRYWSDKADRVIGVEPSVDMRRQAESVTREPNVSFREGFSHASGLSDGVADIVFCMQALHWMEPEATFREAVRILRPGGVFAACDYDWPPSVGSAKAEAAFDACCAKGREIEKSRGFAVGLHHWDKSGHLERMQESGCFAFTREVTLSHADTGDADRFIGLLLTQGYIQQALRGGVPESELGLPEFYAAVAAAYGDSARPWHWSARLRLGVKGSR